MDENSKYHLRYCFEIIFLIDMLAQFFTDYPSNNKTTKYNVRELSKIIDRYIKGSFITDLIPLIPLHFLDLYDNKGDLFLLLKMVRLYKGLEFINITKFMFKLKNL